MTRNISIQRYLPYPQNKVWDALTDAVILGKWFMPNDLKPVLHHEFTFRMAPQKGWDGITHCEIIELDAPHLIAYTYRGKATGEKALSCAGINSETADNAAKGIFAELDTVLRFTQIPAGSGTTIKIEQTGYKGFKMVLVSLIMQMGWKKQLQKLERLLSEK